MQKASLGSETSVKAVKKLSHLRNRGMKCALEEDHWRLSRAETEYQREAKGTEHMGGKIYLLEDLIQTIGSCNFNKSFMPRSNNRAMNKILFTCQIHLSLMKYIIPKILTNMTLGRLSLDRNF